VPVVTLQGSAFAGRVGASLLKAAGLPEGITHSLADYEVLAKRAVADPSLRQAWRRQLREARGRAPLFDTGRFVTDLEALIEQQWARKLASQSPA
jgi:predicted O-linked N-acetylglucosamine transferase (SPINDLY family)